MTVIAISNIKGVIPTVNQLLASEAPLGYNRRDALWYGLKIDDNGLKSVVCLGKSMDPDTVHNRLHSMLSQEDHANVLPVDFDKILHTNSVTGKYEFIPAPRDKYLRFRQIIPGLLWEINHNLGKRPSVSVVDSAGSSVEGEVSHTDIDNLTITFSAEFSGYADLN